jgi:predicted RNase H-like nuclease
MQTAVGVDGCRYGWIAVFEQLDCLDYKIFVDFASLIDHFPQADCMLVDIPIGLPWSEARTRSCDVLARRKLGKRASSVFPAPSREACHASSLSEAKTANLAATGFSLSVQTWNICKKVAEVDLFMRSSSVAPAHVREMHPEVCFWGLNDAQAMRHSKSTPGGIAERLTLLTRYEPSSSSLLEKVMLQNPRKHVKPDDVLDALVGFVTASRPADKLRKLQGEPTHDSLHIPMEIVYGTGA